MPSSFTLKTIQIAVTLGQDNFSEGGNTKIIEGLECEVAVQKPGLPEKNSASVKIWGLQYEDMAQLTMLSFRPLESQHNLISIKAGEKGGAKVLVYAGEITSAFADFNQVPDPCMQIEADSGSYPQQIAVPTDTVKGEAKADRLFAMYSKAAGYTYKNEGVTSSVRNACYPGSPINKMTKLARDVDCELIIDDGQVTILPTGKARQGDAVLLTRDTGMIGYPTFSQDGISCRCIFNPDLRYGGLIKVESIVPRASGVWRITKLTHKLSNAVGGSWESQMEAAYNEK
ncbi:MAG: hypothetical protein LBJ14_03910 [Desulfarculales bacterium]|jgi:hypothetical protein|nr:hypothetical protein [Desulfarculales bacterium]